MKLSKKNVTAVLITIADKLKVLINVTSNADELKVVDSKTQCQYNGYIAFLRQRNVQQTLENCGITA
ncbi:MAG: hypothetical protein ACFFCI_22665 [Promethearchaeota archaeon]